MQEILVKIIIFVYNTQINLKNKKEPKFWTLYIIQNITHKLS